MKTNVGTTVIRSPIFERFPSPSLGRLPSLDEGILASRQNVFFEPGSLIGGQGTMSLDDPLLDEAEGSLSIPQAIFNMANILVGVGVLSVPFALKQSGYFTLLIILFIIYVTATTGKWIGHALEMVSTTELASTRPKSAWDYAFLAEVCAGRRFSIFINLVTVLEVWLALVTFMVLNGGNAQIVWPDVSPRITVPLTGFVATVMVFVPPKVFSYLSLVSTFAMLVAVIAMVVSTSMLEQWAMPSWEFLDGSGATSEQLMNVPRSVGIIVFCFAGHPCFPAVRSSMRSPKKWALCVDISFVVACSYYMGFGLLGYVVFGDDLLQSVSQNLAHIRGALIARHVAALCFLVKVQLTFPLLLNAIIVALWAPEEGARQWPRGRVALAFAVSSVTVWVAVALEDKVAVVASLAGASLVTTTSVLFPAIVHWILACRLEKRSPSLCELAEYIGIICFGAFFAVTGTAFAVRDLLAS